MTSSTANAGRPSVAGGYRAISITSYVVGGEIKYASVWVKETPSLAWAARWGLTSQQDLEHFTRYSGQGYRPVSVSAVDPRQASPVPTDSVLE